MDVCQVDEIRVGCNEKFFVWVMKLASGYPALESQEEWFRDLNGSSMSQGRMCKKKLQTNFLKELISKTPHKRITVIGVAMY